MLLKFRDYHLLLSGSEDRKRSRRRPPTTRYIPSLATPNPQSPSSLATLRSSPSSIIPTTHQTSDDIHILGDLYLPSSFLGSEHQKFVLNLLRDLEALENRDMSSKRACSGQ